MLSQSKDLQERVRKQTQWSEDGNGLQGISVGFAISATAQMDWGFWERDGREEYVSAEKCILRTNCVCFPLVMRECQLRWFTSADCSNWSVHANAPAMTSCCKVQCWSQRKLLISVKLTHCHTDCLRRSVVSVLAPGRVWTSLYNISFIQVLIQSK